MNTIASSLQNIRAYLADQGDADLTVDSSVTASLVSGLRCRRVTDGDVAYATLEIAVEICAPSVSANLLGGLVDYAKAYAPVGLSMEHPVPTTVTWVRSQSGRAPGAIVAADANENPVIGG